MLVTNTHSPCMHSKPFGHSPTDARNKNLSLLKWDYPRTRASDSKHLPAAVILTILNITLVYSPKKHLESLLEGA